MGGGAPTTSQENPQLQAQPPQQQKQNKQSPPKTTKKQETNKTTQNTTTSKNLKNKDKKQTNKKAINIKKQKTNQRQTLMDAKCEHKNPCQFVCLNKQCEFHPFYSTTCEQNCDSKHLHSSKLTSISIKEFQAKFQHFPKVSPVLLEQIQSYKQTLEKLRAVIQDFTRAELQQLQRLQKGEEMSEDVLNVKNSLQSKKYDSLTGSQLGKIWNDSKSEKDPGLQQAQFIKQKMNNVEQLGKCFNEILSNFREDKSQTQEQQAVAKKEEKKPQQSHHMFKRYKLYDDMSLGKEGSWSSTRKP